jgi:lysozyme family protein
MVTSPATQTDRRFDTCLAEVLRWEGGWSDHPRDPGGATMRGVIQRVYDAWRDQMRLPRRSVREIEDRELRAIYWQQYWCAVRADELPAGIDLAVFDFAVNSGPARAARHLQQALGVAVDGHIGAGTLAAAQEADAAVVVRAIMASRRAFLHAIPHRAPFLKGWLRRCAGVEAAALAAVGLTPQEAGWTVTALPEPLSDADAQSATQGRAAPTSVPTVGPFARLWAWGLAAFGFSATVREATAPLAAIDPGQAIGWVERAWPTIERIASSPVGCVAGLAIAAGAVLWLIARRADRSAALT